MTTSSAGVFVTRNENYGSLVHFDDSGVLLCKRFDLFGCLLGSLLDRPSRLLRSILHSLGELTRLHLLNLLRSLPSKLSITARTDTHLRFLDLPVHLHSAFPHLSPSLLQVASNRLEHVLFPVLRLSTPHFHSQCQPFSPIHNAHCVTINVQILDRGLRFRIHCSLLIIPQQGCKYIPIRPVECSIGITPDARKTVRKTLIHTIKPLTTSIHIYTQHNCSAMLSLPNTKEIN